MHGGPAEIKPYVDDFIRCAQEHPELTFLVTEIGCGIAGFTPNEIAPLFKEAVGITNIHLPQRNEYPPASTFLGGTKGEVKARAPTPQSHQDAHQRTKSTDHENDACGRKDIAHAY